jgi:hypothetical protein
MPKNLCHQFNSFDLACETQIKFVTSSARPSLLKNRSWMIVLQFLKLNHPTSKIVQVIHLRCCYNILAALQESYDCDLYVPLIRQEFDKKLESWASE